jgi:hypothetical protein
MAEIEVGPLSDRLSDEEIAELAKQMERLGAPQLPRSDGEGAVLADGIDDDAMTEFRDRLDAHDLAAEIYLPIEFEGAAEVAGLRVASASALLDALDEVKDELDVDEDEDEEEDDEHDDDRDIMEAQLKQLWKIFHDAAQAAMDKKLPLHIRS